VTDDTATDQPQKKSEHRVVALVLAIAAAGAFGYAAFSTRWLYNARSLNTLQEVSFGLNANIICDTEGCTEMSNSELVAHWHDEIARFEKAAAETGDNFRTPEQMRIAELERQAVVQDLRASDAFAPFGRIAFVACLVAGASLAIGALLVLARRRLLLPIMPTTTALLGIGVALISGCVFAALKPGPPGYVGVSLGFFIFGGGVVTGLGSSLMLNKLLRPHDPDLLEDSMNADQF
jgi:hypothetical protein